MIRSAKLTFLFMCKWSGLFALARFLTRRRLKILCYHGFELEDEASFRPRLFMRSEVFEHRMDTIRRAGHRVLALDEAIARLYAGTLAPNSIAITFDDGFHSFVRLAVPVLARYAYPATVYATTYYMQHENPIFRLIVQYMFWKTTLSSVNVQGVAGLSDVAVDLTDRAMADALMWRCIEFGERRCNEGERRSLYVTLGQRLRVPHEPLESSRMLTLMTPAELRDLTAHNVAVELHTHRHHFPSDDREAATREIADNRTALEQWLPGPFRHFCYPSGVWDECQWPWLDQSGIATATTCLPGLNGARTPRYKLRRVLDANCVHSLEFESALSGFSDLLRGRMSAD